MPDPKQMSGIPRPVDDLPNGAISVRLIRGSLSNNLTGHPVDLHVGSKVITVKTDENGRAEFKDFITGTGGATVKATAEVDGEHLESQEFPAPTRGGIRLMLVATDPNKKDSAATPENAVSGAVVVGSQSRFVLQPREEGVDVFYLLDISNNQSVPVNPPAPFAFDMPDGATGTTIMDGSSPQASVKGTRVTVAGPFAPGHTFVQVAASLPADDGSIADRAKASRQSRRAGGHRQESRRHHVEVAAVEESSGRCPRRARCSSPGPVEPWPPDVRSS